MATILQFPQRNKGRIRKSTGAHAEGVFSMTQFESCPDNVTHFRRAEFDDVSILELIAYKLDSMFVALDADTRKAIRRHAMIDAALGNTPQRQLIGAVLSNAFKG